MNKRIIGICSILIVLLIFSILIAVTMGSVNISVKEVYSVIIAKIFSIPMETIDVSRATHDIIWLIRLPRIILAVGVGMGLTVVGVVMQAIVKNPVADPYILGISSGASLGATVAILLGVGTIFGTNYVGVCAFIGAFMLSMLVLLVANIGGRATSVKLILAGMALSSITSAFSSFIVYIANDKEGMQTITYWLMGSLAGAKWETIKYIMPIILVGTIFFLSQSRILNLMLLGDETAITLGTNLNRYRQFYLILTSLIVGFIVFASGMIGFVGLLIPHVIRMVFGTDHKKLLPVACLVGAIFLIWADVASRMIIKGTELPIGILTSMIGGPCFIFMLLKQSYGFGGKE